MSSGLLFSFSGFFGCLHECLHIDYAFVLVGFGVLSLLLLERLISLTDNRVGHGLLHQVDLRLPDQLHVLVLDGQHSFALLAWLLHCRCHQKGI